MPEDLYNDTARLAQLELQARIDKVKQMIDAGVIDQEPSDSESIRFSPMYWTYGVQATAEARQTVVFWSLLKSNLR